MRGDLPSADVAVARYAEALAAKMRRWEELPSDETSSIFLRPTQTLQLELRALKVLLVGAKLGCP